jgi:hypothetical protein
MQAANMAGNKLAVVFQREAKKFSNRASRRMRSTIRFSEALAKCQVHQDVVAGTCEAVGAPASYVTIEAIWPWLKKRVTVPCGCHIVHPSVLVTLCHIFDRHVTDLKDWSLSELVEWAARKQEEAEGNRDGRESLPSISTEATARRTRLIRR